MQINVVEENPFCIIQIFGDVDAASSIKLDKAFSKGLKKGHKNILVDCTHLDYIASAGLGVFISYIEPFKDQKVFFALYGLNEKVKDVFQILGLDQLLTIVENKETAKTLKNDASL